MGSQQLKGSKFFENSHILTYFSIGIASESQQHICNKLRSQHGMNIVETTLHKIQNLFDFLKLQFNYAHVILGDQKPSSWRNLVTHHSQNSMQLAQVYL
jgi:hypothetical protein